MHDGPSERVEPYGFMRADLVRLIMQCLGSLGYEHAAEVLQKDSGIELLSEPVARFQDCILRGEWEVASPVLRRRGRRR